MSKENNNKVNWGHTKVISVFRVYSNSNENKGKLDGKSGIPDISKVYISFKL